MFDPDDVADRKTLSRRIVLLGGAQAVGFSVLTARFFDMQVLDADVYGPKADSNRINVQVLSPRRGLISDVQGRPLASNMEVFRAVIVPSQSSDTEAVLVRFAEIVPLTVAELEAVRKRIKGQRSNRPTVLASKLRFEQVAALNVNAPALPGVQTEIVWQRTYSEGPPVGHIVGFVGNVDRWALGDDPVLRLPDIRVGKAGIEAGYETRLRGIGGVQKSEVNARGSVVRNLSTTPPTNGEDIVLSIDAALQKRILTRLQQERRASAVVIDVASGEVVASVSTPTYDPEEIVSGMTKESWTRLSTSEDKPMLNRAVAGQYPPGSTFKMVTALAGLGAGVISLSETILCDGAYRLAGTDYRCWNRSGHGAMTLHEALRSSCDVFFFELANRVGIRAIAEMARRLGLGQTFDIGLIEQASGVVPTPDWKRGRWDAGWLDGETILSGIGQGYVLATPLQLAVMTARLASGRAVTPTLLARQPDAPATAFRELDIDLVHLAAVRNAMQAVVNEAGGTGSKAKLDSGELVAGKTGTSQVSRSSAEQSHDDLPWGQRDHALFVGYVPAPTPRFAVSAVVEHGGGGGAVAAPLARDVLRIVLDASTGRGQGAMDAGKSAG